MDRAISLALTCLLLYAPVVSASEANKIRVVGHEWRGYTNSDGTGFYWDIIHEVFETQGITTLVETLPWKRAKQAVRNDAADAYVGDYYYSQEDGQAFVYPRWHFSIEEDVIVILTQTDLLDWQQSGLNSLADKKVAWVRGYGFELELLHNIPVKTKEVDDVNSAIRLIEKGRINAFIDYRSSLVGTEILTSEQYGIETAKIGERLYLVFSNNAHSRQFAKVFDSSMQELVKTGRLEQIYNEYQLNYTRYYHSIKSQGLLSD